MRMEFEQSWLLSDRVCSRHHFWYSFCITILQIVQNALEERDQYKEKILQDKTPKRPPRETQLAMKHIWDIAWNKHNTNVYASWQRCGMATPFLCDCNSEFGSF